MTSGYDIMCGVHGHSGPTHTQPGIDPGWIVVLNETVIDTTVNMRHRYNPTYTMVSTTYGLTSDKKHYVNYMGNALI